MITGCYNCGKKFTVVLHLELLDDQRRDVQEDNLLVRVPEQVPELEPLFEEVIDFGQAAEAWCKEKGVMAIVTEAMGGCCSLHCRNRTIGEPCEDTCEPCWERAYKGEG